MVKNIGNKLETKMKSGNINESELLKEATDMMSKMKDMPGMGNMSNLFNSFGAKSKINKGAMNTRMKQAQTRERMREKLKERQLALTNGPKPVEEQIRTPLPTNNKKKKRGGKKKGKK